MLMGYYIISLIFPEMKVSPEEELSLFSSSGCPPQLLLFVPPSGLFPVRTTTSSTELQPLTAQPVAPPLVTPHSRVYSLQTIDGNESDSFVFVDFFNKICFDSEGNPAVLFGNPLFFCILNNFLPCFCNNFIFISVSFASQLLCL